jgi:hypothetical protein
MLDLYLCALPPTRIGMRIRKLQTPLDLDHSDTCKMHLGASRTISRSGYTAPSHHMVAYGAPDFTLGSRSPAYRGTSLIRNSPPLSDHHRTLDSPTVGS